MAGGALGPTRPFDPRSRGPWVLMAVKHRRDRGTCRN
jgi:hypothetical protein